MTRYSLIFVSLIFASLTGLACSASNSSETVSDSVSSPFEWSSDSSGSVADSAYREDVSNYTVAFTETGGDFAGFRDGVSRLAEERGITNWEEDVYTCASIGLGLQRAALDHRAVGEFGADLFGSNERSRNALLSGYASIP